MITLNNVLTIDLEAISHRYMTEMTYLPQGRRTEVESGEGRKLLDGGSTPVWARGILRLLKGRDHRATFFVVGEVHDWYPELIGEIRESGHEIAYHSHTHAPIRNLGLLREEIQKSKRFLDDFRPLGFRAPRAFITERCLSELVKCGFAYDSSSYGPAGKYVRIGGIAEIPISTYTLKPWSRLALPRPLSPRLLASLEVPFGSGYFISLFSLLDRNITSHFIRKCNGNGASAVLCLHPWQLFPRKIKCLSRSALSRLGFSPYDLCCFRAFEHLLENHRFYTISEFIEDLGIA